MDSTLSSIDDEYHRLVLRYCLKAPNLKDELRDVIRRMNTDVLGGPVKSLPKDKVRRIDQLCQLLMKLYTCVKKDDFALFDKETRMQWMCSKVFGQWYYPYSPKIGSFQACEENFPEIDLAETQGLEEIYQGSIEDCSLISSMQACILYDQGKSLRDTVKPQTGGFTVVFHANGCQRGVFVTGDLSDTSRERLNSPNSKLLWPAIIEKAHRQIHGSLEGSNFGNDMHMLTGFAPEYVPVTGITDTLMKKLYEAYKTKAAVLGLAVGNLTDDEMIVHRLTPNHDYSVVGMEKKEDYMFIIRDPSLKTDNLRTFSLKDLYQRFQTLYVCWNVDRMFSQYQSTTFCAFGKKFDNSSLLDDPQFLIEPDHPGTVWALLERHEGASDASIASIEWYDFHAKLWVPSCGKYLQGTSTNNTRFTLCKIQLERRVVGVFRVRSGEKDSQFYTLHCYSDFPLSVRRVEQSFKTSVQLEDSWSPSGGNWLQDTYTDNPQYELVIDGTEEQLAVIGLFTDNSLHVGLHIFDNEFGPYRRITKFRKDKLLAFNETQMYSDGYAAVGRNLIPRRKYVVVCSTYYAGDCGTFKILAGSDAKVTLKSLPKTFGLFKRSITGTFTLRRASRVVLKVVNESKIRVRIVNESGRLVYESEGSECVSYLGSQRRPIPAGSYAVETDPASDAAMELWTDYVIS